MMLGKIRHRRIDRFRRDEMLEQQPVSDIRLSARHGNHAIETEVEDAAFDFRHGTPGADEELVAVGLGLFASDFGRFGYDVVFVG